MKAKRYKKMRCHFEVKVIPNGNTSFEPKACEFNVTRLGDF